MISVIPANHSRAEVVTDESLKEFISTSFSNLLAASEKPSLVSKLRDPGVREIVLCK